MSTRRRRFRHWLVPRTPFPRRRCKVKVNLYRVPGIVDIVLHRLGLPDDFDHAPATAKCPSRGPQAVSPRGAQVHPHSTKETLVNRDQVKGTAKDIAGKIQRKVGEATGDVGDQVKGAGQQIAGKIQKGAGDIEQAAKDNSRDNRR